MQAFDLFPHIAWSSHNRPSPNAMNFLSEHATTTSCLIRILFHIIMTKKMVSLSILDNSIWFLKENA